MGLVRSYSPADLLRAASYGPTSSLNDPSVDLVQAISMYEDGPGTASGMNVNPDNALRMIAVYAAVRILAESVGSLPFPVYRREGRSRIRVPEDYRTFVLNDEPNEFMTAETFWTTLLGHSLLWGNGYAYHETAPKSGKTTGLWPLDPRSTAPYRTSDGELWYGSYLGGQSVSIPARKIIHLRAFGTDKDLGISPIGVARQAIGSQLAAEEYAGRFWQNDARPGGVIEYQSKLTDDQHKAAMRRWKAAHEGVRRSHLVAVLDNGAKWSDVGVPPGDAQFIETRKFGVLDIARLYRIPPYMLGYVEPGAVSYASVEQQSIDFVVHSLRPWLVRTEQAVKRIMFPPYVPGETSQTADGRDGVYPKFLVDGLLRGDLKTRYDAYSIGRMWGWLSANDVAELEDRPGIGPEGDVYLQPLNMVPAGTDPTALAAAAQSAREFLAAFGVPGDPTKSGS